MAIEKNLLVMPSSLHSPASWRDQVCGGRASVMIVADRHELFSSLVTTHDISAISAGEIPGSMTGWLIIGLRKTAKCPMEIA